MSNSLSFAEKITPVVVDFRKDVERCWDSSIAVHCATLHQPDFKPNSAGKAVPASVVLMNELRAAFPDQAERFYLAYGMVRGQNNAPLLGGRHAYVTHHPDRGLPPTVIDVTADQLPDTEEIRQGSSVIVRCMGALADEGLVYTTFITYKQAPPEVREFFAEGEAPLNMTPLAERVELLEDRLSDFRAAKSIPAITNHLPLAMEPNA